MKDDLYPAGAPAPYPGVPGLHTGRLANGLRVIIREDHRTAVAVCNVWVGVGSNREPEALRGWSHGIEHMLFKGTGRRGEGDFAREVAEAGGATNAGTGYETTNYHITVPAENLPAAVDILADALFHSTFDPAALDAERKVLVHENHMYDDIPFGFGVTWRWGTELAFDVSPYRHPIGGRDANLLERSRDEILAFWRSAYRPENMIAVIVGDVTPDAAWDLLAERFGAADPPAPPASLTAAGLVAAPPVEPPHGRARLRIEHGDLKKAYAKLVFPAPGERDRLDPVLGVVRRVLSDGRSCRLYRQVQEEQQLVDDFAVMTETGPREGIVMIDLETDPDRLASALAAVGQVLADLKRESCTAAELERAARRTARGFLFGAETVQGQASNLGHHALVDDLPGAFDFPARVAAVTRDDVAAYSRRVLNLADLSLVVYLPRGEDPAAHGIPTTVAGLESLLAPTLGAPTRLLQTSVPEAPAAHAPSAATVRAAGGARFEAGRLANGAEVHVRVDRAVPVAAVAFSVRGGACDEAADQAGLATLTAMTMVKGAAGIPAQDLHAALESEGASLGPHADRDYTGLFLTGLADRLDLALELTGKVICTPDLSELEIAQEKRLARQQLAAIADNPLQSAALHLRRQLYGDHPYGRPLQGLEQSLEGLSRDHAAAHHRGAWTAADLQIVVSGDVDPDRLLPQLEAATAGLPAGGVRPMPDPGPARPLGEARDDKLQRDQNQAVVLLGWPAPRAADEPRVPMMLLREVLNGQSGRLFESLRNRRSLCYNTGVMSASGFGPGMLVGYVLTAPDSAAEAREALLAELLLMAAERVPDAELARAQAKLAGNLLIGSQANSGRAAQAMRDRIYGRDANDLADVVARVRACTADEIRAAAAAVVDPERCWSVEVSP